jgi:hypothetical protein
MQFHKNGTISSNKELDLFSPWLSFDFFSRIAYLGIKLFPIQAYMVWLVCDVT